MARYDIGELVWRVSGDSSGLRKTLKDGETRAKRMGGIFSGLGKKILAAFAIVGIAKFTKSLIKAGSDAEETRNKFGVVFSTLGDEALEASEKLAKGFGLSRQASQKLLSDTGDLLTGFGLSQKAALELSVQTNTLAGDIASLSNAQGGAEAVSRALTSAYTGEREALKTYGIVISEANVKQELALQASQGLTFASEQEAKAYATLNIALRQSQNSLGDFARSIDSFANQSRIAQANVQNLQADIGSVMVPVLALGLKAFNKLTEAIGDSIKEFKDFVTSAEGARIVGDIIGRIAGFFRVLYEIAKIVFNALKEGIAAILAPFAKLFDEVEDGSVSFAIFSGIAKVVGGTLIIIGSVIGGVISTIINLGKAIFNTGKLLYEFQQFLSGTQSWENVKKQANDTAKAFQQILIDTNKAGEGIVKGGKLAFSAFGDEGEKTTKRLTTQFAGIRNSVSSAVQGSLTATQEQAKKSEQAIDKTTKSANKLGKASKDVQKTWEQLSSEEQFAAIAKGLDNFTQQINGAVAAGAQLSDTLYQNRIDAIDDQLQAELEAAGVAEETAVEKAETELEAAKASGDAALIEEKKKALAKAQIEEEFQKKKAELEYEAAHASWEFTLAQAIIQGFMAPLNAYVSTLAMGPIGLILAPINAALAAVTAGIQIAAVASAEPKPPRFQSGGIVPGNQRTGDNVLASVNSGELILTEAQQENIVGKLSPSGGGQMTTINVHVGNELLYTQMFDASQNGNLRISDKGVVPE